MTRYDNPDGSQTLVAWRRRRAGEPQWDEYLNRRIGDEVRPERAMEGFEIDAELSRLRFDAKIRAGVIDPREKFGWEHAAEKRDKQGHYRELELVLEQMSLEAPSRRRIINLVYETRQLDAADAPLSEAGAVAWIAERMPAKGIRVPKWVHKEELERLQPQVLAASKTMSREELCEHFGLGLRQVRNLIQGGRT